MDKTTFAYWWHNIGSGIIPKKDEDQHQHAMRVAEAAWIMARFLPKPPTSDKNLRLLELRDVEKLTFTEIGKRLGMSCGSACALYRKYKTREGGGLRGLSGRAAQSIIRELKPYRGFHDPMHEMSDELWQTIMKADEIKNEIRERMKEGEWWPNKHMGGYGKKTHCEIMDWLNNEQPTTETP
jgi:hypothetical protein